MKFLVLVLTLLALGVSVACADSNPTTPTPFPASATQAVPSVEVSPSVRPKPAFVTDNATGMDFQPERCWIWYSEGQGPSLRLGNGTGMNLPFIGLKSGAPEVQHVDPIKLGSVLMVTIQNEIVPLVQIKEIDKVGGKVQVAFSTSFDLGCGATQPTQTKPAGPIA